MDELFDFLRTEHDSKYDLIKIALAHHRFAWIHPFHNGNGRVVRLFTYALLIERGFNVRQGRVLNPSAVFCMNRDRYYDMLSAADSGDKNGLTTWCEYVLEGILVELSKIDRLSDYKYLSKNILRPAVACAQERELITKLEAAILKVAIEKIIFKAADIEHLMPGKIPQERSRIVRRMKELRLIEPIKEKGRNYVLELSRGPLLRGIIKSLEEEGFISINVQRPAI
jgi:Fic family protein